MKNAKRILSLVLAVMMILALSVVAFADDTPTTGTITISNATVDKDYTAYKIFDATVDGNGNIAYTYDGTLPENDYFVQDSVGNITATAAAMDNNSALVPEAIEFLSDLKGSAVETITAESSEVVFDNLTFGYYYIETTNGTAVTIDSTNPDANVYDKNQESSLVKKIITGYTQEGTPILSDVNNVSLGDEVKYMITVKAPNLAGSEFVNEYYVYDKMNSALTFNDDIVVTVNGTELIEDDDYIIVTGDKAKISGVQYDFIVYVTWINTDGSFKFNESTNDLVITYSATANEGILTNAAMENVANHGFESQPTPPNPPEDWDGKPDSKKIIPAPTGIDSVTNTYSTAIEIKKVNGEGTALTGAKFKLSGQSSSVVLVNDKIFVPYVAPATGTAPTVYYMLKDGSYTTTAPVEEDYMDTAEEGATSGYVVAEDGYTGEDKIVVGEVAYREYVEETDAEKQIFVLFEKNIDLYDAANIAKKYMLVETVTKENSPAATVDIDAWVNEDGILLFEGLGEGTYTFTELVAPNGYNLLKDPITVEVSFNTSTKTFSANVSTLKDPVSAAGGKISFNVVNNAGTELPATGGMGTVLFIVIGSVLFVATAVVLVAKKRLYNEG